MNILNGAAELLVLLLLASVIVGCAKSETSERHQRVEATQVTNTVLPGTELKGHGSGLSFKFEKDGGILSQRWHITTDPTLAISNSAARRVVVVSEKVASRVIDAVNQKKIFEWRIWPPHNLADSFQYSITYETFTNRWQLQMELDEELKNQRYVKELDDLLVKLKQIVGTP